MALRPSFDSLALNFHRCHFFEALIAQFVLCADAASRNLNSNPLTMTMSFR